MVVGSWINEPVFQCSLVLFFGRYQELPGNAASLAFHRTKKIGCWQQLYTMCTDKSLALVSSYTSPNDCQRLYLRSCSAILRYVIWLVSLFGHNSPLHGCVVCLSVCVWASAHGFLSATPKTNTADEQRKHQSWTSDISLFRNHIWICGTMPAQRLHSCVYTLSEVRRYRGHRTRLADQQALLDRKTVASRKAKY